MKKSALIAFMIAALLFAFACQKHDGPPSDSGTGSEKTDTAEPNGSETRDPETDEQTEDLTGSDTSEPVTETTTELPATEPPATDPPMTKPPATDPPVTYPPVTEPPETEAPQPTVKLLLKDPYFQKGMLYSRLDAAIKKGRLSYSTGAPSWLYSQEMSRYDISKGTYSSPEVGVHVYEDASKYLLLNTNTGAFRMGIKGSAEYDAPRTSDQRFMGALLTPSVADIVYVKDLAHLYVTLDFTLDEVTCCMTKEEFNSGLHTAQWNFYVFVQDSTSSSWFYVGLPLYDYRGTGSSEYIAGDPGTGGTLIYVPTAKSAYGENVTAKVGVRFTQTVDLVPLIERGFVRGQAKKFLTGRDLDNFFISGCNIGWEIPGTFDCMVSVYEFSMSYELK